MTTATTMVSSCPSESEKVRFRDYFRDRLAGLNAGENWGAVELEKINSVARLLTRC
jgi:hypothetical protein